MDITSTYNAVFKALINDVVRDLINTCVFCISGLHSHLLKVQKGTCATCEVRPPEASGKPAFRQGGEM